MIRIVELAGSPAGAYAAKLLADWVGPVTLIGPDDTRNPGPGPGSTAPATHGARAAASADPAAHNWRTLPPGGAVRYLDRAKAAGERERIAELVAAADVVIESSSPAPLTPQVPALAAGDAAVADRVDGLIQLRISPFGSDGPYASRPATDAVVDAAAGHVLLTGDPGREPLQGPAFQGAYAAGLHGAIGVMAALAARSTDPERRGQVVEVSQLEVMVSLHQFTLLRYTHNGDVLSRLGNRYAGPGNPIGAFACADGWISLTVPRDDQLERLLAAADLVHLLGEPGIESTYDLMHHPTLLDAHLRPWLAGQPVDEVVELLQTMRVPAAPIRTMAGLVDDPHLAARRFWQLDADGVREPGPPFSLSGHPWRTAVPESPPPGTDAPGASAGRGPATAAARPDTGPASAGPLDGVRVLDLTRVWAGPLATRILADLGADVVMVEAPWARGPAGIDRSSVLATRYYPDNDPGSEHWNRIGFFNKYAINKRGVALDLSRPEARPAIEGLVRWADVVIENYSPRVMAQLGLDEARLAELNPEVVYVTMPGFGRSGPARDHVAYGPMIDGHAGLAVLQGYRDDEVRKGGVAWPDPVSGMHAAFGVLIALADRDAARRLGRAPRAATIEVAQLEATINMVGHAVIDRQLRGQEAPPPGNRHPYFAPQGVYPCTGDDRWICLAVTGEEAWAALCELASLPPAWQGWDRAARAERHDEIDAALASYTGNWDGPALVDRLDGAGVAAALVADAADVMGDPHLAAREAFVEIAHPAAGTHRWPRTPIRLSRTPVGYRRAAPTLGQHNHEALTGLAGLDDAAVDRLAELGVTTTRPPD